MEDISIHEAKTHLSRLLRQVEKGQEVVLRRGSKPIARIVPLEKPKKERIGGLKKSYPMLRLPDSFFDPLPASEIAAWEGKHGNQLGISKKPITKNTTRKIKT